MIFTGREDLRTKEGDVIRHDLQCVAPTRYSRVCFEGVVIFLALFLLFCSYSWAVCTERTKFENFYCLPSTCFCETSSCDDGYGQGWGTCYGSTVNGVTTCSQDVASSRWCVARNQVLISGPSCTSSHNQGYIVVLQCSNQAEADSARCALEPSLPNCAPSCDSTKWECHTSVEHSQTTISSDKVECFGGDCYGGVYCEYISKSTTECESDCGEFTTQSTEVPIRYEGHCNEENLTDDTECSGVRCISFEKTGSYSLYKLCASREIIDGERKFLPRFVGGGKGNCKNAGYPESNGDDFSSGSSLDSLDVPESCFTMGMGCPPPDTTDYSLSEDRTSQNGCNCEPYDGLSSVSRIVCRDGSISIFMGSCDKWSEPPPSSSSNDPPESSGGSENPTSSGGALSGDWANYSQGQEIIGLLGAIASNTLQKPETQNINTINVALDDYTTFKEDVDVPFNRTDSIYDPSYFVDTAGLRQAIFGRVTEENTILDTLLHPASKCPCFTFFSGGGSHAVIMGSHISLPKMVVDFANFHGFDLCHIISVIVSSLASVVAFFIGFSIFKNVSQ